MADHDDAPKATSGQPAGDAPAARTEPLPAVESPSISPAKADEPAIDEPIVVVDSPIAPAHNVRPLRLALRRRRMALLAASVTVAAIFGAAIGAVAATWLAGSHEQVAGLQERQAMQQSIARLGSELSTLKASLDAASKSAQAQSTQLTKLSQALNEKFAAANKAHAALAQADAEVTGSIAAPDTAPAAAPETPLPQPRPQQLAALAAPRQPPVVPDWRVRSGARGAVLVEGHGEIYEVVPGADLPGLGRVQSIRRVDGRWVVETPKGLIVSSLPGPRFFD
jgi:hypothetical protein